MEILLHIMWIVYFRLSPCLSCAFCIIVWVLHVWVITTTSTSISSWLCSFTDVCMVWHQCATVSFRLHPANCWFQPPPSPVVLILGASDPTYTAIHCWWSCVSGGWKPSLEQSAARRHLSSSADCLSEPPQNLSLFPIISFLTVFSF